MKFQGRIKKLMPVRSGVSRVGNAWRSQDFIFEYFESDDERYSETVLMSVRGEKIDELKLIEGEDVIVDVRCVVKTYGERIYNEVYARTVEKVKAVGEADGGKRGIKGSEGDQGGRCEETAEGQRVEGEQHKEEEDDMPF